MSTTNTVQVTITGGPSIAVPWVAGMNAQQALESAYGLLNSTVKFTYTLQYFGSGLGYLVMMINETYDSFTSSSAPFFYWAFLVNGILAQTGIDGVTLNAGDAVGFSFEPYDDAKHSASTLKAKHVRQLNLAAAANSKSV